MTAPAPVRLALVGYGFGGRWFHAPLIAAAPECELVGVVTTSPERRQDVARDLPGAIAFDALADVVAGGWRRSPSRRPPPRTPR